MDAIGPSLPGTPSGGTEEEVQHASAGANEVFKTYNAHSAKVTHVHLPTRGRLLQV